MEMVIRSVDINFAWASPYTNFEVGFLPLKVFRWVTKVISSVRFVGGFFFLALKNGGCLYLHLANITKKEG